MDKHEFDGGVNELSECAKCGWGTDHPLHNVGADQLEAANRAYLSNNPYSNDYVSIQGALVRLLREPLSWHMRCQIRDAMLVVTRHYDGMIAEAQDMAAAYSANQSVAASDRREEKL